MRYLIDTNIFIQLINENDLISSNIRSILDNYENQIYISSESVKEFFILIQNEKITLPKGKEYIGNDVFDFIRNELNINIKYIDEGHLKSFSKLKKVEGHTDPTDRLIIAQAITEKIPLISSDKKFPKYKKQGLEFIPNY